MPFSISPEQKQTVLWLAVAAALLWLLVSLGPVLTPFIAAGILAYALNPGVDWLASWRLGRFHLPRSLAVTVMVLLLFAAVLALVLVVAPVLRTENLLLQEQIPTFLVRLNTFLGPLLREYGLHVQLDSAGIKSIATQYFSSSGEEIGRAILSSAKVGGIAVLGWIATFVLIPVVLFYLLLDWHALLARLLNGVPRRWVDRVAGFAQEVDGLLAQYLRGQLTVMLVLAAYYSIALTLCGFDVALPVGLVTGLLVFIPYLGFGLGLALATIAAILQFDGWQGLIFVGVVYGCGQILEGFFLTPRLVGERIGLHPLAVIFALLAFGQLFGFVGVLLALPASAIVMVAIKHLRHSYLSSSFYTR
ncbi:MAG: AI-2E family transporter [Burkholderiaceae bacterium]|nr:AI-2E family transporter [Burkholderiaceae bacterium]